VLLGGGVNDVCWCGLFFDGDDEVFVCVVWSCLVEFGDVWVVIFIECVGVSEVLWVLVSRDVFWMYCYVLWLVELDSCRDFEILWWCGGCFVYFGCDEWFMSLVRFAVLFFCLWV